MKISIVGILMHGIVTWHKVHDDPSSFQYSLVCPYSKLDETGKANDPSHWVIKEHGSAPHH
jgi:hypothetical protein